MNKTLFKIIIGILIFPVILIVLILLSPLALIGEIMEAYRKILGDL